MQIWTQTLAKFEARLPELGQDRKDFMNQLVEFLIGQIRTQGQVSVMTMCTHNSRRSQLGMAWASALASHWKLPLKAYSAGVEITACQLRTLDDLENQGFEIKRFEGENPCHQCSLPGDSIQVELWSKLAEDSANPKQNYATLIYCDHAATQQGELLGCGLRLECFIKESKNLGAELEHSPIEERLAVEWIYALRQLQKALEIKV